MGTLRNRLNGNEAVLASKQYPQSKLRTKVRKHHNFVSENCHFTTVGKYHSLHKEIRCLLKIPLCIVVHNKYMYE